MKIKEIMRKDFLKLSADTSIEQAIRLLTKWNVSSAPVFEDSEFLGIITLKMLVEKFTYFYSKKKDLNELRIMPVKELLIRPRFVLNENEDLTINVVKQIVSSDICIPVVQNKTIVGIIRDKDMLIYLLTEFAITKAQNSSNTNNKTQDKTQFDKLAEKVEQIINANSNSTLTITTADKILKIVKTEGYCSAKDLALKLNITEESVEKIGLALEKHKLIEIEYNLLGSMILKRKED
ncbi:MAG: CBS domain-containing protein [Candidatus Micrarchaeota archaeon]|nr:CBS domain-containing protein [Candidatus Micrarchaeota archaeon]